VNCVGIQGIAQMVNKKEFFKLIYDRYNKLVRSVVYFYIHNEQCHDVTQEVFVKAWGKLDSLQNQEKVKAWLMKITMNSIYDFYRKKGRLKEDFLAEEAQELEASNKEIKQLEDKDAVAQLLMKVSEKHRNVIVLYYLHDFSIAEIAESLDESEGTVKSQLHYAKEELQQLMKKMEIVL